VELHHGAAIVQKRPDAVAKAPPGVGVTARPAV
jgi:hypothetical protein